MKNKFLFSIPLLVAAGALYFYINKTDVSDSASSHKAASIIYSQTAGGDVSIAKSTLTPFQKLTTIFHNSVDAYDLSVSVVVYIGDQSQKNGFGSPYIDIAINGTFHAGMFDHHKKPLVVAKLDNVVISASKNEAVTLAMDSVKLVEQALARPFAFEYNEQGSVTNIHLQPDEDEFVAGIKRAIAGRMHFVLDRQQTYVSKTEDNESGKYLAEYSTKDFLTYYKKISKFIDLSPEKKQLKSSGEFNYSGSYVLDDQFQLDFLSATSSHASENELFSMKAESEIILNWKSVSHITLSTDLIKGYSIVSLHQPENNVHKEKQQLAAKDQISVEGFMQQIISLDPTNNYNEIWKQREVLVQSIMADPKNLEGLKKLFESNLTDAQQSLLLGALKDAGTPEAQAALVELVENQKLDIKTRQHALSHMTFLERPSEATIDYLTQSIQKTGGDPEMKATAILALGGAIKSGLNPLDDFEPAYTSKLQSALAYLEQDLVSASNPYERNAYLMGVGNAAQDSSVPTLMQMTNSDDASLRALSADSLRFHKGEAIDNRIIKMMSSDEDVSVQINATRSTVYRDKNPRLDSALLQNAKSAKSEDVRIASLGSLDFRNSDVAEITSEIQSISKSDSSQKVRDFAEKLYQARVSSNAAQGPEATVSGDTSTQTIPLDLANNEGVGPANQVPAVQ